MMTVRTQDCLVCWPVAVCMHCPPIRAARKSFNVRRDLLQAQIDATGRKSYKQNFIRAKGKRRPNDGL
jgi:hypothetical protein